MLLTKNYKDILNGKLDFYESIIEDINFVNCSDLQIKVLYFFNSYQDKTLKIIFKDCEEFSVNNKKVLDNKKRYSIVNVCQEIDKITITEDNYLLVEITTNFESDYIKLKCLEIWVEIVD